jgi:competence protein ComEC
MRLAAIGFLFGIAALQQLADLPGLSWSWLLVVLAPALVYWPRWRLWLCIGVGFCWASIVGHALLANALDPALEGKDVLVEGVIASLPEVQGRRTRFQFVADKLTLNSEPQTLPGKLLLSWYGHAAGNAPKLNVGERWRLKVRLKRPHGFMNPGGFDYEAWLFRQGVRAKGYVRAKKGETANRRLVPAGGEYPVNQLRQSIRDELTTVLGEHPLRGIVMALAIGDRQQISREQWDVLTRTGTNHLVAISGLHVGLVAGFAFFVVRRLWRLSARAVLRLPAAKAGAFAGLSAALIYALLAGFSVPTQRALLMVAVVMLAIILQRRTRPSSLLALALILVLVIDPLAVLAPGFWLSFGAVAVILYGMVGRIGGRSHWWRWGRTQWLVAVGLFPALVLLFQKASLVAPLANLVAVPWVSLVTVPLTLTGTIFLWILPIAGETLLGLAALSVDGLWWLLEGLASWPLAQWVQAEPPLWAVVGSAVGVAWLLAPKGMPARWVGIAWFLPLAFLPSPTVPPGEAHFALLDVGQGLAAVVQTQRHALVFDAGPRFSSGFNTGGAVVVPYLRSRGIGAIDTLVVSHGDNDHIGGVADLVSQITVNRTLSSVPGKLEFLVAEPCVAGERWHWDGVDFEILNPGTEPVSGGRKANNRSCVLRVQAGEDSLLLSADIEKRAERHLVRNVPGKLAADVLVAPHHGSKTSSTPGFLDAVSPQIVLFPVGYRNRYGFPKQEVVARYREHEVTLFDTASHGAIEILLGTASGLASSGSVVKTYRQSGRRYWHNQPLAEDISSD